MSDAELRNLARIAAATPTMENLAALGAAYLRQADLSNHLSIVGRRWFNRRVGQSFHAVDVYLNDQLIGQSGVVYGYDNAYMQTGIEIAIANGKLPPLGDREPPWQWAERIGLTINYLVDDVRRRRDLTP